MIYNSLKLREFNLDQNDIKFDNQISSTLFQMIMYKDKSWALDQLINNITHYLNQDINKFKDNILSSNEIIEKTDVFLHQLIFNKMFVNLETIDKLTQENQLDQNELKLYPQDWDEIKNLCTLFLENSDDLNCTKSLIDNFKLYQPQIKKFKEDQGHDDIEISKLQEIYFKNNFIKIKQLKLINSNNIQINDWSFQTDLDNSQLKDRIKFCEKIQSQVNQQFNEILIDSKIIDSHQFKFAPVKNYQRAKTKLIEYILELKTKNKLLVSSALQKVKDLLRGSITCINAENTQSIFNCLTRSKQFDILNVKNGFSNKTDHEGNIKYFDKGNQADIKIIMCTKKGIFHQDELVEIQLIQKVDMDLKKIEHKIQDFTREEEQYQQKVETNQNIEKSLSKMKNKVDRQSAEHISNSHISSLETIKTILKRYFPYNQIHELSSEELFNYKHLFKESYEYIGRQLQILNPIKSKIQNLHMDQLPNLKYELFFDIDQNSITTDDIAQIDNIGFDKHLYPLIEQLTTKGLYLNLNKQQAIEKRLNDLVLSNCGKYQFICGENNIRMISHNFDLVLHEQKGHETYVNCIIVSSDTQQLQSCSNDCNILQHSVHNNKIINKYEGHTKGILNIILSENEELLISISIDKTIKIFNTMTSELVYTCNDIKINNILEKGSKDNQYKHKMLLDKEMKHIYQISDDYTINKVNIHDNSILEQKGHSRPINLMIMMDSQIISGSMDTTIKLWDTIDSTCLKTFKGHSLGITQLIQSSDKKQIYSGSYDQSIHQFSIDTTKSNMKLIGHKFLIAELLLCNENKQLISCSIDKTIRQWSTSTGECLKIINCHSKWIRNLQLSCDEKYLQFRENDSIYRYSFSLQDQEFLNNLSTCMNFEISEDNNQIYAVNEDISIVKQSQLDGKPIKILKGHQNTIHHFILSIDQKQIQSCSKDGFAQKFNIESESIEVKYQQEANFKTEISISYDNKFILIKSLEKYLQIQKEIDGVCLNKIKYDNDLVLMNESQQFKTNSQNQIKQINIKDNTILQTQNGYKYVRKIIINQSKQQIQVAQHNNIAIKFDTSTGLECVRFQGHKQIIWDIILNINEEFLFTSSRDETIRQYSTISGQCLMIQEGHTGPIEAILISFNEEFLYSCSRDNSIIQWSTNTGDCTKVYNGHSDIVNCLRLESNGKVLLSSSFDKTIRKIWIQN